MTENWKRACPQCGDPSELSVRATIWAALLPDGYSIEDGEADWNEDSNAYCGACGWDGKAWRLKRIGEPPVAHVRLRPSLDNLMDLDVWIYSADAITPADEGLTSKLMIRRDVALFELRAYRRMGYRLRFTKRRRVKT